MFWVSTYLRMGTGVVEDVEDENWAEVQAGKLPATSSTDKICGERHESRLVWLTTTTSRHKGNMGNIPTECHYHLSVNRKLYSIILIWPVLLSSSKIFSTYDSILKNT